MHLICELRPDINWNDENRVKGLYATFRTKELSPQSWDSKMNFWSDVINKWLVFLYLTLSNPEMVRRGLG